MRYKLLGKSGLRVSEICLGTITFGSEMNWGASSQESQKIYENFREAGGNFIDTANVYTHGASEKLIGEFITSERERVVISTKYSGSSGSMNPNGGGNHRKNMIQSVEASLKRLNTDYIDLLLLHAWDFMTPVEEVMRALDDLVRAGKILYIGISNAPAWIVSQCNTLAELRGWTKFISLQIPYNLIERTPERELLPMARTLDIGVTAASPLASGWLTGKYSNGQKNVGVPRRLDDPFMSSFVEKSQVNQTIAQTVDKIAKEIGQKSGQVALSWLRSQNVIPIIGIRQASQATENLKCIDFNLSSEHLQQLNQISQVELGYPNKYFNQEMVKNFVTDGMFEAIDNHRFSPVI